MKKLHVLCMSASAFALGWCGMAGAQTTTSAPIATQAQGTSSANGGSPKPNTLSEVVVTAERRTTNLQKTPIAATVLTQGDLLKNGVFTIDQLQFVSPSLTVNNFGQGDDVDIRGIGKGEHNTQTGTGVVTYRDGVASFPGYFAEEPYYDVSSVEVLRGPQGTFSGQNATGGAVIVNTHDPVINGGYSGYFLGSYGNYNATAVQAAVNLPINDTLAARVALNTDYQNPYAHLTYANLDGGHTGDPDTKWASGRLSLLWTPTSKWRILFKVEGDYLDNGGYFGQAILNPTTGKVNPTSTLFDISNNYETYAVDQFFRTDLKVDYLSDSGITFRSISGYQKGRTGWKGDIDGTDVVTPATPDYIISEASDETEISQEFNIISPEKGPFSWIAGAYYNHNEYAFPQYFDVGVPQGGFDEDLEGTNYTHTYAGFGQVSFNLPAGFQLQGGVRYSLWSTTNHTVYFVPEYVQYGFIQGQRERYHGNNVTGKVTLNWNLNSTNFLYAFIASGSKPGGLNTSVDAGPTVPIPGPFKQEYVVDYEFGWKSTLLNNHLRTQVGGYYNQFKNFQVIVPLPNNPEASTELNDPSNTKLYGLEAQAQAVFGSFSTSANLGLEHTSLGAFYTEDSRVGVGGTCDANTGPTSAYCINLQGHSQTYAPDFTFSLLARYDYKLADGDVITPSANFSHISGQWGTLFANAALGDRLTPRNILGASLAWTRHGYTVTAYGYNLTDDHYVSALLPPVELPGAPRTFGVSVLKSF
jgi:iron complex outermembrane receptor protein